MAAVPDFLPGWVVAGWSGPDGCWCDIECERFGCDCPIPGHGDNPWLDNTKPGYYPVVHIQREADAEEEW